MGVSRYKKTAACECGCDYGSNCGKTTTFLFCYNRSVDIGGLYIKEDSQKPESQYRHVVSMTDNQINALLAVLESNEKIEELTEEDIKLV